VRLWNVQNGQMLGNPLGKNLHSGVIRGLAFSRDGLQLLSVSDDGEIRLWTPSRFVCMACGTSYYEA
jgi:WD40 repeat protein